jgi:hypothetical protein
LAFEHKLIIPQKKKFLTLGSVCEVFESGKGSNHQQDGSNYPWTWYKLDRFSVKNIKRTTDQAIAFPGLILPSYILLVEKFSLITDIGDASNMTVF